MSTVCPIYPLHPSRIPDPSPFSLLRPPSCILQLILFSPASLSLTLASTICFINLLGITQTLPSSVVFPFHSHHPLHSSFLASLLFSKSSMFPQFLSASPDSAILCNLPNFLPVFYLPHPTFPLPSSLSSPAFPSTPLPLPSLPQPRPSSSLLSRLFAGTDLLPVVYRQDLRVPVYIFNTA